jgi:hypothetical protein
MISRRSVWIAFFLFLVAEVIIGCQGADLGGVSYNNRANGYAPHATVPPLNISDSPNTQTAASAGHSHDTPQSRVTDAPRPETQVVSATTVDESPRPTSIDELHKLHNDMVSRAAHLDSYIARFRRREVVNGKDQPEEIICFKFRAQPWSVDMKWLKPDDAQGREVLYVKGRYDDKLHVLIEKGMPLVGGTRRDFGLNDPMIRGRSRHEITEAGIHEFVHRFHDLVAALDRDDKHLGTLVYRGETKRPEFEKPVIAVEHIMPPGFEPLLPQGGHRFLYIDPTEKLPLLVVTQDDRGKEVEYYCFDGLQANVRLDEADFNPANMTAPKK